ncbi:threonine synthase, partial [Streptomyces roseolus]
MRRKGLASMAVQTSAPAAPAVGTTGATVDLGPASGLSCRECGEVFALGPIFACELCFGPLEVAYELPVGDPEELRK